LKNFGGKGSSELFDENELVLVNVKSFLEEVAKS
jgi:hypothetical protein